MWGVSILASNLKWTMYGQVFSPEIMCPSIRKVGGISETGKWVCGVGTFLNIPGCIVYIVGTDSSPKFAQEIQATTSCEVHVFDPYLPESLKKEYQKLHQDIHYHDYTIAKQNGKQILLDASDGPEFIEERALSTILEELGHKWIDVLSVEVSGTVWEWLAPTILHKKFPVSQVILHVDTSGSTFKKITSALSSLMNTSFRLFHSGPNLKGATFWETLTFSFVRVTSLGALGVRFEE